ncbi:MAG TPA: response regulator [Terriglobales bacterium]|nr:response regulator [Terriglobales bacterium]
MHSKVLLILAVEDNEVHGYALKKILENEGFKVALAGSGNSGLRSAELLKPDLVLLDVNLPDMDGFTVCRRLKEMARERKQHLPVVIYTAQDSSVRQDAKACGADCFLTYPVEPQDLVTVIKGTLSRSIKSM